MRISFIDAVQKVDLKYRNKLDPTASAFRQLQQVAALHR